ncbi:hypothetical protein [Thiohalocapsa sp. ML1]|jgi:hypothetical protein|uniref:hypothetical protein n=1 Tax=Thiohalocapsa sp. ML1 TaxID=1431688 RepID=UPI0012E3C81F|nr:hypothetical protein [Thiohalocapsa sp. ML1]
MAYEAKVDASARQAADALTAQAQDLGLGTEWRASRSSITPAPVIRHRFGI